MPLPKYPARIPIKVPMIIEMAVATAPMRSEILAPAIRLASTSLPMSSVPRRCLKEGERRRSSTSPNSMVENGIISGPKVATIIKNNRIIVPVKANLLWSIALPKSLSFIIS